jgi:hypothetical protein
MFQFLKSSELESTGMDLFTKIASLQECCELVHHPDAVSMITS